MSYCFGNVPPKMPQKNGRHIGTFSLNGWAREVRPVFRSLDGVPKPLRSIHCKSAELSCTKAPKQLGRGKKVPCGKHTCFRGIIKGNAEAAIKVPFPHHANR